MDDIGDGDVFLTRNAMHSVSNFELELVCCEGTGKQGF